MSPSGSTTDEVHLAPEERLRLLLQPEVPLEELPRVVPLEGDDEVEVAGFGIEALSRSRAQQIEALDAVAPAQLGDLRSLGFYEKDQGSTLPRNGRFLIPCPRGSGPATLAGFRGGRYLPLS
jgi:hypothetical protein